MQNSKLWKLFFKSKLLDKTTKYWQNQSGVSLIESLLVIILIASCVFLLANIPNALGLITKSRNLGLAREIATKQIEEKRATSFINLVDGQTTVEDSRLSILPQASGQILVENCDSSICTNLEDLKHVKVTISWKENNKTQNVILDTFIGEGGLNQ